MGWNEMRDDVWDEELEDRVSDELIRVTRNIVLVLVRLFCMVMREGNLGSPLRK